jgi:hypothetical protein
MKIIDYTMVTGKDPEALRLDVMARSRLGWEVYGGPLLLQKPVQFWQAMVNKFDPHAGEVWLKDPGRPGQWVKEASVP